MKDTVSRHFERAELAEPGRFVSVIDGAKKCVDHDSRWGDPRNVPGENYGIYVDEGDRLVILDVDYHREGSEELNPVALGALSGLPATLKVQSPHVPDDDRGGHRVLKLEGDDTPAELFEREFGTKNPVPSWGEVIAKNKYVVGPGSQLDTCDKEWCEACSTPDGGRYTIKKDREIATVDGETLIEALAADPDISRKAKNQSLDDIDHSSSRQPTDSAGSEENTPEREYTREEVKAMLEELPGRQHFDEWIRTGYAVYDWNGGETGKEVFEEWSKTNPKWEDGESQRQIDYIWNNAEDGDRDGKTSVGTLVYKAKDNGWEDENSSTPPEPKANGNITWDYVRERFEDSDSDDKLARRYAAVALRDRHEYLYVDKNDDLLKYNEEKGVFEKGGRMHVQRVLARELGVQFSTHDRNEVLATVQDLTAVDVTTLNAEEFEEKLICLENGVLNLNTRELNDHDPKYKFNKQIPVEYDPTASAPAVKAFLDDVTETEGEKQTLIEMIGATLYPEYLKSKFLFLFGEGSNGKGVYFELINRFLGTENVEGRGLHELADNRFAKADLHGKLANIGGDIDDRKLKNVGTIKRLTSNTDPITAERKFGQPFKFVNSTTLFFAANEPPAIDDMKRSMGRRLVPIHMATEFVENPDPDDEFQKKAVDEEKLIDDMTADEELAGLLNMALDGMDRLRETGDVSLKLSPMERLEYYQRFSDPIYRFANDCLQKEPGTAVEKADVYEVYKSFSREEGHGVRHNNVFWREFRRVFHFDERRPRQEDGTKGPRELADARLTAKALKYAPKHISDKYADIVKESREEGGSVDETPGLKALKPGRHTVEATIAEKLEPKPWLQAEGTLVDDGELLDYIARGDTNPLTDVSEGDRVRITDAKVGTDRDGLKRLEVSNVCDVQTVETPDANQSALDEEEAATATDGSGEVESEQLEERVKELLRTEYGAGGEVSAPAVAGALGATGGDVSTVLDNLAKGSRLLESREEGYILLE